MVSSKLPGSSVELSCAFPTLGVPVGFLTLHSRKQNYFLLLLSGLGSPPPSHHHHCCAVQKKPSSVFPCVLSIGGTRAVCSVTAAVVDFLPALSWASSLPGVNHIFSHTSSVWPQNPHLPPAFVSFPLRCSLDTICNPAAVSCGIIALSLVPWSCILIGFVLSKGNGVHSPHQTKWLGQIAVMDHCSLAQLVLWDMGCL